MRKFILYVVLFITLSVVSVALLICVTNKYVKKHAKFKVPNDVSKIIIGHSHSECAYNDSLITNLKNFSKSGESYFYNYYKVLQLLKQNKQIKTVFVEFSNNQINEGMDSWIWEEPYLSRGYKIYGPFININSKVLLAKKSPLSFFNSMTIQLGNNLEIIQSKDYDYTKQIGGYLNLKKNKIDSFLTHLDVSSESPLIQNRLSKRNIEYLKKIISSCQKEKIKIYLIRSPFHKKYAAFSNESVFQNLLKSDFKEIEFLDFKDFPLKNSEYADFEHLNYLGAKKFSVFFNSLLNNGLLDAEGKQDFIKKAMLIFK